MGGVKIKSLKKEINWEWSEYKSKNMLNIVKASVNLIKNAFPFVKKRNKNASFDQEETSKKLEELK